MLGARFNNVIIDFQWDTAQNGGSMEDKLGITTTPFPRGRNSGLMTMNRKWNEHERKTLRDLLDRVYDQFKGRIKESRGTRLTGDLEGMAGGRVFTGVQALERGLIDKIGGLHDALALARNRAGLDADCPVYTLPKPSEFAQVFAMLDEILGDKNDEDEFEIRLLSHLGGGSWLHTALPILRQIAPQHVEDLNHALQTLLILEREQVGCFMPCVPSIR